jgi:hypothetical protein
MDLAEGPHFAPAKGLVLLPILKHIYVVRGLIKLLNQLVSCANRLFRIYEKKGLYSKINNMAVATDMMTLCLLVNTFFLKIPTERTTKYVVGTMVIACNIAYLMPDTIVFKC